MGNKARLVTMMSSEEKTQVTLYFTQNMDGEFVTFSFGFDKALIPDQFDEVK